MGEEHHPEIDEARYHYFEKQEVSIDDFESSGRILDIGGGGEGIFRGSSSPCSGREISNLGCPLSTTSG